MYRLLIGTDSVSTTKWVQAVYQIVNLSDWIISVEELFSATGVCFVHG